MSASPPTRNRSIPSLVIGWLGLVLHLATGILLVAAGLVAPLDAIVILWLIWLALLGLAIWLLRNQPVWTILVPIAALPTLFGAVMLGESLLGWSA
ncbi:hypothetical protein [Salinibacterium sp. ZJ454]|uniref:hypothetical protein n=1 Tax=Salinibacterium sp. ZJ454 TaxID=2708339 RepID=UPI001422AFED|nr:hypothetical protein [Salinibacterium sp. ZJ454]